MSSLISIISAILNGEQDIPGLKVRYFTPRTSGVVNIDTDWKTLFSVAQLQTLIKLELERAEIPRSDVFNGISVSCDPKVITANSIDVHFDSMQNVRMLKRLIVEVVRQACPQECEIFNKAYYASPDYVWSVTEPAS